MSRGVDRRAGSRVFRLSSMGLRTALFVSIAAIVPSLFLLMAFQIQMARMLEERQNAAVALASESFAAEVDLLVSGYVGSAEEMSERLLLHNYLRELRDGGDRASIGARFRPYLRDTLRRRRSGALREIYVVTVDGETLAASSGPPKDLGLQSAVLQRPGMHHTSGQDYFLAWSPVTDTSTGAVLGTVVLKIDLGVVQNQLVGPGGALRNTASTFYERYPGGVVLIADHNERIIAGPRSKLGQNVGFHNLDAQDEPREVEILGKDLLALEREVALTDWHVFVGASLENARHEQRTLGTTAMLFGGAWAVLLGLTAFVTSNYTFTPIAEVTEAAERLGEGDWDDRVDSASYRGEALRLGESFNTMADRLQESFEVVDRARSLSRDVVARITSSVLVVDAFGKVVDANPEARCLLGEDVMGRALADALADASFSDEIIGRVATSGACDITDVSLPTSDSGSRWFDIRTSPVPLPGEDDGRVVVLDETTRLRAQQQQLAYLATHDELTGLPNRRMLEQAMFKASARAKRGLLTSVVLLDIDNFRSVNATYGPRTGDVLLAEVAGALRRSARKGEEVFRAGDDEFAVVLNDVDADGAEYAAERLRQRAALVELAGSPGMQVSLSAGVVAVLETSSARSALSAAESALLRARELGANRTCVYRSEDDPLALSAESQRVVELLGEAIRKDLLTIYFQPVARSSDGFVEFNEVLVRLKDPATGGIMSASAFVPLAERFGLVHDLTRAVLRSSFSVLAQMPSIRLSINLSGTDLHDEHLPEYLAQLVATTGVDPSRVMLEVTETVVIQDIQRAREHMGRIRELGFSFALDDFGVGYNSFGYLRNLPVDMIKIDGSYVTALQSDPGQAAVISAIWTLARLYHKKTAAEFVESPESVRILRNIGIDYLQGFLIGRPRPEPTVACFDVQRVSDVEDT
ncbi:MAG: EAL domain-containing protein [Coriobacteriales bacterium]|nr:EAL domain-containing protein [Coriobacteriales bacterium]